MHDIVFWGATGHAKVLNEALFGTTFRLVALVDNREIPSPIAGIPVLKGIDGLDRWIKLRGGAKDLFGAIAVGGGRGLDRIELMNLLRGKGLKIKTIVHRTAFVADDAFIGEGCQILSQAAVCTHVKLGTGVIVNTAASVDHDCVIGDGVHLSPGARLTGEIRIGDRAFIGASAVILPRITIGNDAIVGAGAVVTTHVPPPIDRNW